jgi:CRP-like cAMP-binding protein
VESIEHILISKAQVNEGIIKEDDDSDNENDYEKNNGGPLEDRPAESTAAENASKLLNKTVQKAANLFLRKKKRRAARKSSMQLAAELIAMDKMKEEGKAVASVGNIHPDSPIKLYWDVMICFTLLYYAVVIPLRIALHLNPNLFYVDYFFDLVNILDNYLYVAVFAVYAGGELLAYDQLIRAHYIQHRLAIDLFASVPYDLIALGFLNYDPQTLLLIRALLRLPKMTRLLLLMNYYSQFQVWLHHVNMNLLILRVCELVGSLLLISHWIGCGFYLFAAYGKPHGSCDHTGSLLVGSACRFRGTWVEQQIATLKLPANGGTQWDRFLKALNWAITTSVGISVGDVWVLNINEVLYAFFVMFCGLAVNGMILGSVMTLVNDASAESTRIYRNMELLQAYLLENDVPIELINRASAHLRHLATSDGSLIVGQDAIFAELPHSIKLSIDSQVKTGPLRRCPIFDFCSDEVLRGISAKLQVQFNVKGDKIITGGELGHEMFFIESGSVHVMSNDGNVLYATLEEGAFFGETAFFFRSARSATVSVASSFCVCLRLTKTDLEHELRSCDFDPTAVLTAFTDLQASNERRNKAVTQNLELAKRPNSKLFKMIKTDDLDHQSMTIIQRLRIALSPNSFFRMTWDIMGFGILVYYCFTIPFYVAFLGQTIDQYLRYSIVDYLFDFYWVVDIFLKLYIFSFQLDPLHDKIITDPTAIKNHYLSSEHFFLDIVASLPLEIFALVPGTKDVLLFTLRLHHLLRVPQLEHYTNLLERHLRLRLKIVVGRSTAFLLRATVIYLIITHWFSCGYFMLHRYAERDAKVTYVVADKLSVISDHSGRHDVCSKEVSFCYARTVYYVLGTLTGIGYGDIAPYTNLEYTAQIFIAIFGAFIAAALLGFCGNFLEDVNAKGNNAFRSKIDHLEAFCKHKKLKPVTRLAILAQYTHMWKKVKSTSAAKIDVLGLLSQSSAMDLSLHLQSDIINKVPMLRCLPYHIKRRIAYALKPQVVPRRSCFTLHNVLPSA